MRAAYPTTPDLISYAAYMGLASAEGPGSLWAVTAALAGAREWERRTGYFPFLGATDTRQYDPPVDNSYIALDGGLLSLASLTVGVFGGNPGTVLTDGTQFRLLPVNAPSRGLPYEMVEFLSAGYGASAMWPYGGFWGGFGGGFGYGQGSVGRAQSVQVVGAWGRQAQLSEDVWRAVLSLGLISALPEIVTLVSGGLVSYTQGDVSETFGVRPFGALEDRLTANVERALPHYKRQSLVMG